MITSPEGQCQLRNTKGERLALRVNAVSKRYAIWTSPAARLHHPVLDAIGSIFPFSRLGMVDPKRAAEGLRKEFRALHEVSLEVRRGESVGIIGKNGSGKSTLLQIIAGTVQATSGTVEVEGKVAALLELGSGFNPEFTGRENVFLNASILGLSRHEIMEKMPEIEAFAEIDGFMDQPVKSYSSGMLLRLAFSVQVAVVPDILIVDEALSVGDVFFQQKCFTRIRQMQDGGTSLLFVSHDLAAIQSLCDRCLLLAGGEMIFEGPPEEAVVRYYAKVPDSPTLVVDDSGTPSEAGVSCRTKDWQSHDLLKEARTRHGTGEMVMEYAVFFNERGEHQFVAEMLGRVAFEVLLTAKQDVSRPILGLHLFDRMNQLVFASGSEHLGKPLPSLQAGQSVVVRIALELNVQPGLYTFNLVCGEPCPKDPNGGSVSDCCDGLGPITVWTAPDRMQPFYGIAQLPMRVEWSRV